MVTTVQVFRFLAALGLGIVLTGVGLVALGGHTGVVRVADDEIALIVGRLGGSTRVLRTPGFHLILPFFQGVQVWKKSPREYRMQGNDYRSTAHVPRLIARGPDGSSFWFERVVVHYTVADDGLPFLLRNAGTDPDRAAGLVDTFARPVLKSRFGRYSATEIASVENQRAALAAAEEELGRILGEYGLEVLQAVTSKPRFPADYEATIQRRKVADQETEALLQEVERLRAGSAERLAQLRRKKELERMKVEADLQRELEKVRRSSRRALHEARVAFEDRSREGAREREAGLARATWQIEAAEREAEGLSERVEALATTGRPLVRRAVGRMLARASVSLLPTAPQTVLPVASSGGGE